MTTDRRLGDRGRYGPNKKKQSKAPSILLVILLAALIGCGWFYWERSKQEFAAILTPYRLSPQEISETSRPVSEPAIKYDEAALNSETDKSTDWQSSQSQEEQTLDLPKLLDSDKPFKQALIVIAPGLAPWLSADQLIRKTITIAHDFSQGVTLENHMRFLKPSQPFTVELNQGQMLLSNKSYQRYDGLVTAIEAIDVKALATNYKKFRPLFLQVFAEFSYPEEYQLEDILEKSAEQVLAAPVIEEPIALIRPSVYYKYADKNLEALSAVSKQMIRMGPENTRILQYKVQQMVEELASLQE